MKKDRKTKNSIWNKFRMALGCHLEDRMIEAGRKNRQKALSELTNEIAKAYPELSVTQSLPIGGMFTITSGLFGIFYRVNSVV